jgi:hypothetical protein
MRVGVLATTARMNLVGLIACPVQEVKTMPRELHWSIGNHDEDEEVVEPCGWCGDEDGDDCRCYAGQDEEEYRV